MIRYNYHDGGAKRAGICQKGWKGGCAVRAIAMALRIPYKRVYNELLEYHGLQKVHHAGLTQYDIEEYVAPKGWMLFYTPPWIQAMPIKPAILATIAILEQRCYPWSMVCTTNHVFAVKFYNAGPSIQDKFNPYMRSRPKDIVDCVFVPDTRRDNVK